LTSLRFFAALFVVLYHLVRQVGTVTPVSELFWFGRSGVTFFFVLSGFVLAWTYVDSMPSLQVFWWRRFARIWPLHITATLLSVAAYVALGRDVSATGLLAAVALVHAWSSDPAIVQGGNPATWSLSDEAFFYLCFPLLLSVLGNASDPRRRAIMVTAGALVTSTALWLIVAATVASAESRAWALDYFPPVRLLQFAAGVALGIASARGWRPQVSFRLAGLAVLGYCLLLLVWRSIVPESSPWGPYSPSQLFSLPIFSLVVLAAARRDLSGRTGWLGAPWLVRLGHWSFAWYLIHEVVIRLLLGGGEAWIGSKSNAAVWLAAIAISQVLAAGLYSVVEHPAERRLRPMVTDYALPR
jgi:peptidoglycan/LPS O-acetylase OafA/YrhL